MSITNISLTLLVSKITNTYQSINDCTKPLGSLRQAVFACLTCNPPPADPKTEYKNPAGVCYSCSVQCHGEHNLVEIFTKRNFTCDCGTKRLPATSPCSLRINPATNTRGGVHSEEPDVNNKYNQNFRNRFCGCECDYDPFQQKGTMFQCLGLGTVETGGCGEDWWHPGCLVGLGPEWHEGKEDVKSAVPVKVETAELPTISEDTETATEPPDPATDPSHEQTEEDDPPPPPGFPAEDDFEGFICYKCVEAYPWIRRYAGAPGFLPPVYYQHKALPAGDQAQEQAARSATTGTVSSEKRKADDDENDSSPDKKQKLNENDITGDQNNSSATGEQRATQPNTTEASKPVCKLATLSPAPAGKFSLFFTETCRENICHCPSCFPLLIPHPQLMEEEETYEPPVSEDGSVAGGSTNGGGSLLDRGQSALQNVDRVRAIEGVMAYNHLKDKLKPFFQQFAESGQAISAEDIKEYFAKLRGDETGAKEEGGGPGGDLRREQSGY